MTFDEISKEHNLPAARNIEYVYGEFKKFYSKKTEEIGMAGDPRVFQPTFYWWASIDAKVAALPFAFSPGDLAVHNGKYVVVVGRLECSYNGQRANVFNERTGKFESMHYMEWSQHIQIKYPDGALKLVHCTEIKFADIPQEIYKLACNKANTCPMMSGKENT